MNMNLKEVFGKKDAGGKPGGKPEGKKPLTEAQRIRRNKMIASVSRLDVADIRSVRRG